MSNYLRLLKIIFVLYRRGALFLLEESNLFSKSLIWILSIFSIYTRSMSKGRRIKLILEDLGPFFIKFGQTLATRSDLVGIEVAEELSTLQDRIEPNLTKEDAENIIKDELGIELKDIFKKFSTKPVAAASIAEVFKAEDVSGNIVAVKLLKPAIEKAFRRDLKLFLWLARLIENRKPAWQRLKLEEAVREFERVVKIEMDLTMEAAAASELQENNSDDSGIYIPKIYWDKVSQKVLVMEWIDGEPVNNAKIKQSQISKIAKNLTNMFLNQAYKFGFFHADLHHGNMLLLKDGRVALIDFGIMGRLDRKTKLYLAEILKGFLSKDYYHVAKVHFDAGYVSDKYSMEDFAQACRSVGEPIVGMPANKISIGKLLTKLFKVTRDFEMETQLQLLLVQKTTVVIEGVISNLDPNVNMWEIAEPWVQSWSRKNMQFDARMQDGFNELVSFIKNDVVKFIRTINEPKAPEVVTIRKTGAIAKLSIILLSLISAAFVIEKLL